MYTAHRTKLSPQLVAQLAYLKFLRQVNRQRFYAPPVVK